jgi:hypothetical protein
MENAVVRHKKNLQNKFEGFDLYDFSTFKIRN